MHSFTFENYLFRRHIAIQSCNRSFHVLSINLCEVMPHRRYPPSLVRGTSMTSCPYRFSVSNHTAHAFLGQWPDMVYLPPTPTGNFVDHDFLEASCLASFLQHVSPLAMEALPSNSPLHMLLIQRHKFNIKRTEVRINVNICRCSIKSYFI